MRNEIFVETSERKCVSMTSIPDIELSTKLVITVMTYASCFGTSVFLSENGIFNKVYMAGIDFGNNI